MTDEQAALAWLELAEDVDRPAEEDAKRRATIRAMLAQPTLPEEPSRVLLAVMRDALIDASVTWGNVYSRERHIYAALRAELLKPATKTVERYHVESFVGGSLLISPIDRRDVADVVAGRYREEGRECVRITGPHSHEVPG